MMLYFMTAFLLWANQAPNLWWIWFIIVLVLEVSWRVHND
jgi:hypothetical protein